MFIQIWHYEWHPSDSHQLHLGLRRGGVPLEGEHLVQSGTECQSGIGHRDYVVPRRGYHLDPTEHRTRGRTTQINRFPGRRRGLHPSGDGRSITFHSIAGRLWVKKWYSLILRLFPGSGVPS